MKQYMILNITESDVAIVSDGDTREEAFSKLADVAVVDDTYIECRMLGAPIVPKERKAVTLSRVAMTEEAPEPEAPEPEPEEEPVTTPRRRRRPDEEEQ